MPVQCSVVIATFNRPELLQRLLDDLALQRSQRLLEIIVVDDGSEVDVRPLLAGRATRFPLLTLRQENAGPATARHAGILRASGEVVLLLDDDMSVGDDFVESHLAEHDAGATVVMGLIRPAPHLEQMPIFEKFHADQLDRFVRARREGRARVTGTSLCTGNVSFRRSAYLECGGFDPSLKRSEDRELGIRLEKAGARLTFSERAASVHRSDHDSLEVWLRRAFLYGVVLAARFHSDSDYAAI